VNYPRGSEWAKWDLHVHTASSYDAEYKGPDSDKLLCEALIENNITAVAITDHFIIDSERIVNLRKLAPSITFFPGVELRTDKGAPNLHVILIFSEKSNLKNLSREFNVVMRDGEAKYAKSSENDETVYWTFEDIIKFGNDRGGIVSLHAGGKTNGIDKEITNATPVNQAIKKDISKDVHFFEIGKISDINDYNKHVFKEIPKKPLIICSDCHNPKKYSSKENLWIKANPTFQGLTQCIFQPEERVFIGDLPPKLEIVSKNKSVYINAISVSKNKSHKNNEEWFDFEIPLNCGLAAIIGNKGSGKSAFSDIIGHLCNSNSMNEASFLNNDRFRKSPKKLANDYSGNIEWLDGKVDSNINLGEIDRKNNVEYAQYLPQKYIEKVCNDLEDQFQEEINKVIFSYIDITEKEGSKNLKGLIDKKSVTIFSKIVELQNDLSQLNKDIISLEEQQTKEYKDLLRDQLDKKEDDLERHEKNKPNEVKEPKDQNKEHKQELDEINTNIDKIEEDISNKKKELTAVNKDYEKIKTIKEELNSVIEKIEKVNKTLRKEVGRFHFSEETFLIKYTTPLPEIDKKILDIEKGQDELKSILDNSENADEKKSLYCRRNELLNKKTAIISKVNSEEKDYQKYLDDLKEWNQKRSEIIGSLQQEGSIQSIKAEMNYLEKDLFSDYKELRDNRLRKVKDILIQKKKIAEIYESIYKPVEKEIMELLGEID